MNIKVALWESHVVSFICWTLILLYVKSIVGRQQSRSKMCFVSCLKPWRPELHKLPILCPGLRKINLFVSDKQFVIKKYVIEKQSLLCMPSSKAAIVGVSGSLDHWDTRAHVSGLIHTGTDASRRKESRGQHPTVDSICCSYAESARWLYANFNLIPAF